MFVSELPKGTVVIDDSNASQFKKRYNSHGVSESGYVPRDLKAFPVGSMPFTAKFPKELYIPREQWKERIEEKQRKKTRLSDLCTASPVKWLNQSPSWYCWCYAVVHAVMVTRIVQNEPYRALVPESVAGPIKNYRKQGGWGSQALKYIAEHGVADETVWPRIKHADANTPKYFEGSRTNAAETKIDEWWDLSNDFDAKASLMLRNFPVPSGYNFMGHEMCSIDLVVLKNGGFGCMDLDSYAQNGKYNTQVLSERQGRGEDMVAPITITPAAKG